jgi:hypothetical protein
MAPEHSPREDPRADRKQSVLATLHPLGVPATLGAVVTALGISMAITDRRGSFSSWLSWATLGATILIAGYLALGLKKND